MRSNLEWIVCHLAVSLGCFSRIGHCVNFLPYVTCGDYGRHRSLHTECTHTHSEGDQSPNTHRRSCTIKCWSLPAAFLDGNGQPCRPHIGCGVEQRVLGTDSTFVSTGLPTSWTLMELRFLPAAGGRSPPSTAAQGFSPSRYSFSSHPAALEVPSCLL